MITPIEAMRRRRSDDGFTLITTIVVIAFFSVMVTALLGMAIGGSRVRVSVADQLAERRAIDAVLDVGLTNLKTDPLGILGRPGNCSALTGLSLSVDGQTASLDCTPETSNVPPVAGPGGVALRTLGGYTGSLDDAVDNRVEPLISGVASGLGLAFRSAFDQGPGLAHYGTEPLKIAGDVRVRNGAFGYRFTNGPGGTSTAGPSPAISIAGTYQQGQCGPLGCLNFSLFGIPLGSSPACGLLLPGVIPGQEFGTGLQAAGGPQCNLGTTNALFADPAPTAPTSWSTAALRSGPGLPATCPQVGNVVTIQPGAYGVASTRTLNTWFLPGNCDNVTFWFPPGDYYFDAAGLWAGERNSLVLADPTAKYVFGAPRGWTGSAGASAGAFPGACDAAAQGVSITLTARTSIKHRAGLAAACGKYDTTTGDPLPLVYQPTPTNSALTWAGRPAAATSTEHPTIRFQNPELAVGSAGPAPVPTPAYGPAYPVGESPRAFATTSCAIPACSPSISFTGFSDPAFPAPYGPIVRSSVFPFAPQVFLKLRGTFNIPAPLLGYPALGWSIAFGDGSGLGCAGRLPATLPNNPDTQVLTVPVGQDCFAQAGLSDASQLEGATVRITYELSQFCLWSCPTMTAGIDHVWLESTTDEAAALPAAMEVAVDPANGTAMYYNGPVYVPRSQTEIRWLGSANSTPLFIGGLVTRALASGTASSTATNVRTGTVAAGGLAPGQRVVTLRATIDGRVRGSARVIITDGDPTGTSFQPGRLMEVVDWNYCDGPPTWTSCNGP